MDTNQIVLLEQELFKLDIEISNSPTTNDYIINLNNKRTLIKKELAKLRIQVFEEREYLDFDDDYR
jgi:hypothetical protein